MQANCPSNNDERLEALRRYQILDTEVESEYDDITQLVADYCEAPIAVINLIDRERQWFKSEIGLGTRETPLDISICAHAILQPGLFEVEDTLQDERFAKNPLVTGDPHLRFYAGALLETHDGYPLGTLCVLDYKPRKLDERQRRLLTVLARQVMQILELRLHCRRQQKQNEEMAAQIVARDNVTSIVSHDLRSPLSSSSMAAKLLLDGSVTQEGDVKECASIILNSSKTMLRLVEDLSDVAAISQGDLSLKRQLVSPVETIEVLSNRYAYLCKEKNLLFECGYPSDLPAIQMDPDRIAQALENILSNALKFTPAGGYIRFHTEIRKGSVVFIISDTGPGISDEELPYIFQRFWQSKNQQFGGRGLGLAIVKGIVEAHEGRISVARKQPSGSVFEIYLPIVSVLI